MKQNLCIFILLSLSGYIWGQNNHAIRTPKDYLFCAEGAYDRRNLEQTNDTIPPMPDYLKKLTYKELNCLNRDGFYKDIFTGYAGAVFMDTRDSTIIIAHRGTELAGKKSDIRDIAADAQIAGNNILNKIITRITKIFRTEEEINEMLEIGLQYPSAKRLTETVMQQFTQHNIEQTGHSLGGSTTQLIAYEFGMKGITFDPAGVGNKIYLDTAKKENLKNITNYKVHQSLVSSSVTTGKNIGKIIAIYPTDGEKLNATKAHGVFEIFYQAINLNTGYFKTFDEVVQELWNNNGTISETEITGIFKPTTVQTKIQDKFETSGEYKGYLIAKYNITKQQEFNDDVDELNQNSVQFYPINLNNEEGQTIKSMGSFIVIDNTIEKGTYRISDHKDNLFILLNETDLLKLTTEFLAHKLEQRTGNYKFQNTDIKNEE